MSRIESLNKTITGKEEILHGYIPWISALRLEDTLCLAAAALDMKHPDALKIKRRLHNARRMINRQIPREIPECDKGEPKIDYE